MGDSGKEKFENQQKPLPLPSWFLQKPWPLPTWFLQKPIFPLSSPCCELSFFLHLHNHLMSSPLCHIFACLPNFTINCNWRLHNFPLHSNLFLHLHLTPCFSAAHISMHAYFASAQFSFTLMFLFCICTSYLGQVFASAQVVASVSFTFPLFFLDCTIYHAHFFASVQFSFTLKPFLHLHNEWIVLIDIGFRLIKGFASAQCPLVVFVVFLLVYQSRVFAFAQFTPNFPINWRLHNFRLHSNLFFCICTIYLTPCFSLAHISMHANFASAQFSFTLGLHLHNLSRARFCICTSHFAQVVASVSFTFPLFFWTAPRTFLLRLYNFPLLSNIFCICTMSLPLLSYFCWCVQFTIMILHLCTICPQLCDFFCACTISISLY